MVSFFKKIILLLFLMFSWDLLHYFFKIDPVILPTFHDMIKSFLENFPEILYAAFITLLETGLGLVFTFILSLFLVIFINEHKQFKKSILNFIYLFQMIPLIAIAPLFIIWLGFGIKTKVVLIMLYSSFAIIVSTLNAFENIQETQKLYMLSLTSNKKKLYRYLYFPMSYPQIFAGIKIAVTYSVVCAITGEYIGSKAGLGILLNRAYSSYQTDLVFVVILVIILMTVSLLKVTGMIEMKLRR